MATSQHVRGFEILDSRGNPTVAAGIVLIEAELGPSARFAGRAAVRSLR